MAARERPSPEPLPAATPAAGPGRTPKNIVLLSDGTGNAGAKAQGTNVWALYEHITRGPEQVVFYDDGVGTQKFVPMKLLSGAFGYGLFRNVKDLYTSLVRVYERGDRIFLFGFSRGAYTVRTLAGLITRFGIVDRRKYDGDEQALGDAIDATCRSQRATFGAMRADATTPDPRPTVAAAHGTAEALPGPAQDVVGTADPTAFKKRARRRVEVGADRGTPVFRVRSRSPMADSQQIRQSAAPAEAAGPPEESEDPGVDVAFVGVWDTVEAVGAPLGLADLLNRVYQWKFPDRTLNPRVGRARHALSIDDERMTFHPNLWEEQPSDVEGAVPRIQQVWFSGVHTNVGGGYDKDQLAYLAFAWMVEEAVAAGLRFPPATLARLREMGDPQGMQYDSRAGMWAFYRYEPREVRALCANGGVRRILVHDSVYDRVRAAPLAYAPIHLPLNEPCVPSGNVSVGKKLELSALNRALRLVRLRTLHYHALLLLVGVPVVAWVLGQVGRPVDAVIGAWPDATVALVGLGAFVWMALVILLAPLSVRSPSQPLLRFARVTFGCAAVALALAAGVLVHRVLPSAIDALRADRDAWHGGWLVPGLYALVVVFLAVFVKRSLTRSYRTAAMDALAPLRRVT